MVERGPAVWRTRNAAGEGATTGVFPGRGSGSCNAVAAEESTCE